MNKETMCKNCKTVPCCCAEELDEIFSDTGMAGNFGADDE